MKLHPGDIVEIETSEGLAYAQVTHNHASYPEVVRVLSGLYDSRPADIETVARKTNRFVAMLTLGDAIDNKRVKAMKVGSAAVPQKYKDFPVFRMSIRDKQGGIAYWWLWDGEGLSYVTELDEKTSDLPMREVMSLSSFMDKINAG